MLVFGRYDLVGDCGDAVKIHGEKEIDMKLCRLWRAIRKIA